MLVALFLVSHDLPIYIYIYTSIIASVYIYTSICLAVFAPYASGDTWSPPWPDLSAGAREARSAIDYKLGRFRRTCLQMVSAIDL